MVEIPLEFMLICLFSKAKTTGIFNGLFKSGSHGEVRSQSMTDVENYAALGGKPILFQLRCDILEGWSHFQSVLNSDKITLG